jgi:hypothetical protein
MKLARHPDGAMTGVSKNYFPLNAVLPGDNPVDALVACAAPFLQEHIKNLIWLYGSQNTTVLCEELKWRLPLGLCMMLHGLVLSEHATFVAVPSPIASIFESIGYDIPSSSLTHASPSFLLWMLDILFHAYCITSTLLLYRGASLLGHLP